MREIRVILHNVRSVYNVASIFRTADAAGVLKIYLCGITPTPFDRLGKSRKDFIKVSLGAEKYVKWEKISSTTRLIDLLKKDGFKIYAVEQSKFGTPFFKFKLRKRKSALILGSEIRGIPAAILKKADKILEIPMRGKKESLNVSVAFGIILFQLVV